MVEILIMLYAPTRLRCEYLSNPLGLDVERPRFSWQLEHEERRQNQHAYRIIVASTRELAGQAIGDLWDSGKIYDSRYSNVIYDGKPLISDERCYWRTQCWDQDDRNSPFSAIASFQMGLLNPDDWCARWISKSNPVEFSSKGSDILGEAMSRYIHCHAIYLRKAFHIRSKIQQATVYICGLGLYELFINGQRIGDHVLDPGQTDYHKLALYASYHVEDYLQSDNAIAVILGNGRHIRNYGYSYPKLILQLHLHYDDGSTERIVSDGSWKVSHGPLTENGLYYGERYDARLEMSGWDRADFNDSSWQSAIVVDGPRLASQMLPPIKVTETLQPQKTINPSPDVLIYDFGQNFTGWVHIRVRGKRNTELRMRHAELIHENGMLNPSTNQNAEATDIYILKGGELESYEPRFTCHGFRYVEISGSPTLPFIDKVEGRFVHSAVEKTGQFHCSSELINHIHHNILWGQLSNLMSIPTDCPQRDERYGWLGDAHLSAEEAMFNFDMAAFYTKYLRDIQLAQKEDGSLPDTVPPYLGDIFLYPTDPAWGTAYISIAWLMYRFYEDLRILETHYESMRHYIGFLRKNAEGHIISKLGKYGDWCPPGGIGPKKTPVELTATWYYYHDVLHLVQIAGVLGEKEDELEYRTLAEEIRLTFNQKFLTAGQYTSHHISSIDRSPNQTSQLLPLALRMVPEGQQEEVLKGLLHSIVNTHDCHPDTGIFGTRYLFDVLTEYGHTDIAYRIATQISYPGWGYMIAEGATTLWERWEKLTGNSMNSHNHIMFGSIDAWFYRVLAGVTCLSPGWRKVSIKPPQIDQLTSASATIHTISGLLHVSWRKETSLFQLSIRIPVGVSAIIHLPMTGKGLSVKEGENILWRDDQSVSPDLQVKKENNEYLVVELQSGLYQFLVTKK